MWAIHHESADTCITRAALAPSRVQGKCHSPLSPTDEPLHKYREVLQLHSPLSQVSRDIYVIRAINLLAFSDFSLENIELIRWQSFTFHLICPRE